MAVAPDFLLTSSSTAALGKATSRATSASNATDTATSPRFSDVFAKEQPPAPSKPVKTRDFTSESKPDSTTRRVDQTSRKDDDVKAKRQDSSGDQAKKASPDDPADDAAKDPVAAEAVADSGKTLPADTDDKEVPPPNDAVLDPLFLLGMTGQFPAPPAAAPVAVPVSTSAAAEPASVSTAPTTVSNDGVTTALPQADVVTSPLTPTTGEQSLVADQSDQLSQGPQVEGKAETGKSAPTNLAAVQLSSLLGGPTEQAPAADQVAVAATLATAIKVEGDVKPDATSKGDAFADRLTALSQGLSTSPQTARPVTATVPGQALSPQAGNFSEAVVDRVMWMSSQNLKSADIQMEPAQLGKLEVRIDMSQDQTQVTFASPHADVRAALDDGAQRLRDLFAQQGMNLANVNVSDQSSNQAWQQSQQGTQGEGNRQGRGERAPVEEEGLATAVDTRGTLSLAARSLVDYYA